MPDAPTDGDKHVRSPEEEARIDADISEFIRAMDEFCRPWPKHSDWPARKVAVLQED